jgi:phosphatidylserine/phosphatidylglycerophosphate/cardiolipin synthase-like enzyme
MVPEAVSNRKVRGMQYLQNREIYDEIILKRLQNASKRMRIATANIKDVQVASGRSYISILKVMKKLCRKGVRIEILHAGIPSEPFLRDFKKLALQKEPNFVMRRCLRVHFKCVLIDDRELFIGSPNLTGAGMGAKGVNRRNFEIGVLIEDGTIREKVNALFGDIWEGRMCERCGRKRVCYVPLEEPS